MTEERDNEPEASKVAAIRERLEMTQQEFADLLGVDIDTVFGWEEGWLEPVGPARGLLQVLDEEPDTVLRALSHSHTEQSSSAAPEAPQTPERNEPSSIQEALELGTHQAARQLGGFSVDVETLRPHRFLVPKEPWDKRLKDPGRPHAKPLSEKLEQLDRDEWFDGLEEALDGETKRTPDSLQFYKSLGPEEQFKNFWIRNLVEDIFGVVEQFYRLSPPSEFIVTTKAAREKLDELKAAASDIVEDWNQVAMNSLFLDGETHRRLDTLGVETAPRTYMRWEKIVDGSSQETGIGPCGPVDPIPILMEALIADLNSLRESAENRSRGGGADNKRWLAHSLGFVFDKYIEHPGVVRESRVDFVQVSFRLVEPKSDETIRTYLKEEFQPDDEPWDKPWRLNNPTEWLHWG